MPSAFFSAARPLAYRHRVTVFWAAVSALAAVAGVVVAVVFGILPYRQHHRTDASRDGSRGAEARRPGRSFSPPPVLDVEVRGRDALVVELTRLAARPDGRVHVLSGLGGSGKSTIARAVAAQIVADGGQVWWVSASDPVSMTQLLLGLARELGASRADVEEALSGRVNPSDVLWRQLEEVHGWTLLLDNADEVAGLSAGDRPASSGAGWLRPTTAGLVVITSRVDDAAWGRGAAIHPVEPLKAEDGGKVLRDLAPRAGTPEEAQLLAERLAGLPLALHQAGSYLASPFASAQTFAKYRQTLARRFGELWTAPGSLEALIPGRMQSHASTTEVP